MSLSCGDKTLSVKGAESRHRVDVVVESSMMSSQDAMRGGGRRNQLELASLRQI